MGVAFFSPRILVIVRFCSPEMTFRWPPCWRDDTADLQHARWGKHLCTCWLGVIMKPNPNSVNKKRRPAAASCAIVTKVGSTARKLQQTSSLTAAVQNHPRQFVHYVQALNSVPIRIGALMQVRYWTQELINCRWKIKFKHGKGYIICSYFNAVWNANTNSFTKLLFVVQSCCNFAKSTEFSICHQVWTPWLILGWRGRSLH